MAIGFVCGASTEIDIACCILSIGWWVGHAIHARTAFWQAGAIYALGALAEAPNTCSSVTVAGTGASQLLSVASITRLSPGSCSRCHYDGFILRRRRWDMGWI